MISCKNSKNLPDVAIDVVINDNLCARSAQLRATSYELQVKLFVSSVILRERSSKGVVEESPKCINK